MGRQNNKLLKNIEKYEQKEKIKQSKSQILGQKLVKRTEDKEKSTRLYHSQWSKGICDMVR